MISQSADIGFAAAIASRIAETAIEELPFPHLVIDDVLPPAVYAELLRQIPPRSQFDVVDYPGTGFGPRRDNYHDFGYLLREAGEGHLGALRAAFTSEQTARALLDKFGRHALAVPFHKRGFFADSAQCSTACDLQVDLPGYAIAPHADDASELVNFQLFLVDDDSICGWGTRLCIPDDPRVYKGRKRVDAMAGAVLSRLPRKNRVVRRLERSKLGLRLGVGGTATWMPWEWFKVVKVVEARPNRLLAFAPNDRSFQGAEFSVPSDAPIQECMVLRGAVCQKN